MRLAPVAQNLALLDQAEQLLRNHGLEPEPGLGVAPSTLGHRRATARAG